MKYGKARELVESAIELLAEADNKYNSMEHDKSSTNRLEKPAKPVAKPSAQGRATNSPVVKFGKRTTSRRYVTRSNRWALRQIARNKSAVSEAINEAERQMSPVPNRPSIRDRIMNPFNLPFRPGFKPPSRPTTKPNPNDPIYHGFDPWDIQTPTNIDKPNPNDPTYHGFDPWDIQTPTNKDKPSSTPTGPARKSTGSRKATGKVGSRGKVGSPSAAMGAGGAKGSVASPSAAVGIAEGLLSRINRRG